MRHTGRRAIVTCGENILVARDYRADFGAGAGRPLGHLLRDGHEVLIPAQPFTHE